MAEFLTDWGWAALLFLVFAAAIGFRPARPRPRAAAGKADSGAALPHMSVIADSCGDGGGD